MKFLAFHPLILRLHKLGRRRIEDIWAVSYLVKVLQGKKVRRNAADGGVRADDVVIVGAPVSN